MKDKIVKLLSLTQSDNDHEALSAIRMANKLLKAQDKTWSEFMGVTNKEPPRGHQWPEYQRASELIEQILNNYPVWFDPRFVRDLDLQLKIRGHLTPKQMQALEKIYYKIFQR